MPNSHVEQRLIGIQSMLMGAYHAGASLSSATKGSERATFIDSFLSNVLPPIYRFGTGDATDAAGHRSGQLDVVMEYPFSPSLPIVGANQSRLYLSEGVAAVIEVKSNAASQWKQAEATALALKPLTRTFGSSVSFGPAPTSIPLFVVGYTGYKTIAALQSQIQQGGDIFGALIIDTGLYVSQSGIKATGPWSLWGLIFDLHRATNGLQSASTNPLQYAL